MQKLLVIFNDCNFLLTFDRAITSFSVRHVRVSWGLVALFSLSTRRVIRLCNVRETSPRFDFIRIPVSCRVPVKSVRASRSRETLNRVDLRSLWMSKLAACSLNDLKKITGVSPVGTITRRIFEGNRSRSDRYSRNFAHYIAVRNRKSVSRTNPSRTTVRRFF